MKTVPLAEVRAGEKLARDLRDGNGRMILARGTLLSPALINLLHNNVAVTDVTVEPEGEEMELEVQRRIGELEQRFAGHEACPYMQAIQGAMRNAIERGMGPR